MSSTKTSSSAASMGSRCPVSFLAVYSKCEFGFPRKRLQCETDLQLAVGCQPVYKAALRNPQIRLYFFASRRDCDVRAMVARELAQQAGATGPRLSRRQGAGRRRGAACDLSA